MAHPHTTRSSSVGLSAASSALDTSDNSVLTTALQVASHLSDLGKAVPFVAPAFVLLKIIIDIEQRAQDVDIKCTDILDRISFMLSHLPVLKDIEIQPSTRKVVDRITEAMKGAVGLITAYRKQNKVARRLSLSNREKFTLCAEGINTCCRDLLMSLQIHQSKQLEVLVMRGVPVDEDDRAARTFVDEHGGTVDALLHDRELVKEFANERHFMMDDSVMDQLNANFGDSVRQTTARLEEVLKRDLSTAVVDGFKDLLVQLSNATLSAQENERRFVCVQCESSFVESTNYVGACTFHKAPFDTWARKTPCCSTAHPCSTAPHRSKHHCDYPYATFFPRAQGVDWYVDTHEEYARVEDTNLEVDTEAKMEASVSRLVRWATRGERTQEPTLLVKVGKCWWTERYFWGTWTSKELEDVARSVRLSKRTLIFNTTKANAKEDKADEYAMAEWILSISGKITGVRVSAKSSTSPTPFVRICPLDLASCTQSGDVIAVSDGGMRSYAPGGAYNVPSTVRYGPTLDDTQARPPRTNFKTRVTGSTSAMKLVMKSVDEPALTANPDMASYECDYFVGKISLFNNNTTSNLPITISTIRAESRLVGVGSPSPVYTPVPSANFKLLASSSSVVLPLTLSPRETSLLHFQITIKRNDKDKASQVRWWNRAFNRDIWRWALRVKLVCEEMGGDEASLVGEYVWSPMPLEKQKTDDRSEESGNGRLSPRWFSFDNPVLWKRCIVKVERGDAEDELVCGVEAKANAKAKADAKLDAVKVSDRVVLKVGDQPLKVKRLHRVVYTALKTGRTEVDLEIGREHNAGAGKGTQEAGGDGDGDGEAEAEKALGADMWYWDAYALVDVSCRRVYAVKVVVRLGAKEKVEEKRDSISSRSPPNPTPTPNSMTNPKPKPKPKAKTYPFGCVGYVLLPPYGDIVPGKTRPVSYATESVRLPKPKPESGSESRDWDWDWERDRVLEDGLDDWKPNVPPKPVAGGVPASPSVLGAPNGANANDYGSGAGASASRSSGHTQWTVPPELSTRLDSIDRNLERIADVLERLAGVLVPNAAGSAGVHGHGHGQTNANTNDSEDPYGGVVDGGGGGYAM